jgi:hypothetical protein
LKEPLYFGARRRFDILIERTPGKGAGEAAAAAQRWDLYLDEQCVVTSLPSYETAFAWACDLVKNAHEKGWIYRRDADGSEELVWPVFGSAPGEASSPPARRE